MMLLLCCLGFFFFFFLAMASCILFHAFDDIRSINLINYMLYLVCLLPNNCCWFVQRKYAAIQVSI
jgi:hypothetical protein